MDNDQSATARSAEHRIVRFLLIFSFGIAVLLGVLTILLQGRGLVPTVGIAALGAAALLLRRLLALRGRRVSWLMIFVVVNFLLLIPEMGLRVAGYEQKFGLQFGWPDPREFHRFDTDPELFWIEKRGRPGINSLGFRNREIETPKPPRVRRIVFLGDSCTAFGKPVAYPVLVEARLNERVPASEGRFESVNLSVPGYSSHQGRVVAERHLSAVDSDIVFVFYGWNDHWQAFGATDAELAAGVPHPALRWASEKIRLIQFLRSFGAPEKGPTDRVRVPLERYRENLRRIVELSTECGVPAILVTAPTTFYRLGVPSATVDRGMLPDHESGVVRHRAYSAATREVAAETDAQLLDLASEFEGREDLETLILKDGIHFREKGLEAVADRVAEFVIEGE